MEYQTKEKEVSKEEIYGVDVTVNEVEIDTDPASTIFIISCLCEGDSASGQWRESANTKREVEMFERGMKAMAILKGNK